MISFGNVNIVIAGGGAYGSLSPGLAVAGWLGALWTDQLGPRGEVGVEARVRRYPVSSDRSASSVRGSSW